MKRLKFCFVMLTALVLAGCSHFGGGRLVDDRFNFNEAIGDSWKDQMLLNLVKLRYGDTPVFLGVQSVIAQHNVRGSMNMGGSWSQGPSPWAGALGGSAEYSNSPTVTYAPMQGKVFGKSMLTPIPPMNIINLIQSGYSVKPVLRLTVKSINGLRNVTDADSVANSGDNRFYQLLDVMAELQHENYLAIKDMKDEKSGQHTTFLRLREPQNERMRDKLYEFRSLLGLDPTAREYTIIFGLSTENNRQIAILTRSILDVLTNLSDCIEVPPQHVAENRASKSNLVTQVAGRQLEPLMRIQSGGSKPSDAFTAVTYRGNWYWVEDRDFHSKFLFSFLMVVMQLVDTGEAPSSPSLVLPAGG